MMDKDIINALNFEMVHLKKMGILWPKRELIKSIGYKWYLLFWKRNYLMQKEILRRVWSEG